MGVLSTCVKSLKSDVSFTLTPNLYWGQSYFKTLTASQGPCPLLDSSGLDNYNQLLLSQSPFWQKVIM